MYGDFILIERNGDVSTSVQRLPDKDTAGRTEAWLRDTLLAHPEIIPVQDIEPSFGPIVPLCKELRTSAGPIDAAFINQYGKLTLVECKLWRNPESRRKVVAQILDYATAVSKWSYSDLQSNVARALGRPGNAPYELVKAKFPEVSEHRFIDSAASAMKQGRFLLIIAGDGIREDVSAIAEYIRNASTGFSLGLVEVAMYGLPNSGIAVQPRILAKTKIIEKTIYFARHQPADLPINDSGVELSDDVEESTDSVESEIGQESIRQSEFRRWWKPVLDAQFDHPDQEPAVLHWPNNIKLKLPWPSTWVTAYRIRKNNNQNIIGISTGGRAFADQEIISKLEPFRESILSELPEGSMFRKSQLSDSYVYAIQRDSSEFASDKECTDWIIKSLNCYVNAFRPRIKQIIDSGH